jgi:hypothetical protein
MSLLEVAVLAMIAAGVGAFCASLKWLSLSAPFRKNARQNDNRSGPAQDLILGPGE